MKKRQLLFTLAAIILAACTSSKTDMVMVQKNPQAVQQAMDSLRVRYADIDTERAEKGIAQAAALWKMKDGSADEFVSFCMENYVNDPKERELLFDKLSRNFELIFGNFNEIDRGLKVPLHEVGEELTKIDYDMGAYNVAAHFMDDMFSSKVAFAAIINFPAYSLSEKQQLGEVWSGQQWGYARMGDVFTSRIPAEVEQAVANANTAAENYVADYNIAMGGLRSESGEQLFPSDMMLISHWGLRDELKSNYADEQKGLEKQRVIYSVMKRIVAQEIPKEVLNNSNLQYFPISNKTLKDGKEVQLPTEHDKRYQIFIDNFKSLKAEDAYTPQLPTYIRRAFEGTMEFSQDEVRSMFTKLISSPQVKEVAALIEKRLGRPLEPFDIWYDGFKARSSIDEDELTARTVKSYPTAADFEKDMPNILRRLGFSLPDAQRISSRIEVDAARGSGHAWGAAMKGDKAHLRTRIPAKGMDYKGYNIAMHELGHNVEQTISLYDVDYYIMNGVPNTAFTEALAFIFQKRDLEVLGVGAKNLSLQHAPLQTLDIFWGCYEIMGVALVDMAVWEWLYANPDAKPAQLKENVMRIAGEIWNAYYAPVLGERDSPILAIYSHMINTPLYLANYPMGHLIEFQLEEVLRGKNFAAELQRIYRMGRLAPQLWMKRAAGSEVSVEPMLKATTEAVQKAS